MNKILSILNCGSYSLATMMVEMFMSIKYAYTIINFWMLDGQMVSADAKTKFQISKTSEMKMLKLELNGTAKRA